MPLRLVTINVPLYTLKDQDKVLHVSFIPANVCYLNFSAEPNAIKDFFPVNTGVFLYLQEKNTDCNAINTFYLYLQEEFTDKIYRRISPVITGVFL
jgi:hypothetical protein